MDCSAQSGTRYENIRIKTFPSLSILWSVFCNCFSREIHSEKPNAVFKFTVFLFLFFTRRRSSILLDQHFVTGSESIRKLVQVLLDSNIKEDMACRVITP